MTIYNPNDFYPRTGQEVKSDGTTVNEADGINPDGSENNVITGKKTQQILGHIGLAITDTSNHDVDVNVSALPGMKALVVTNTTNQTVNINLYAKASNYLFASMGSVTVAAGGTGLYTDTNFAGLRTPLQTITIRAYFSTAPSSGTISTFIEGTV